MKMIDFVKYTTLIYSNLKNANNEILKADVNTCYINSIIVCNTSPNTITINLTKSILFTQVKTGFLVKNLEIPPAVSKNLSTIDLVKYFGIEIFLPVDVVDQVTIGSVLNIYSGGINQTFDCIIDYSILTELPIVTLNSNISD